MGCETADMPFGVQTACLITQALHSNYMLEFQAWRTGLHAPNGAMRALMRPNLSLILCRSPGLSR